MIRYGIIGYGRIGQRLAARLPGAVGILRRGQSTLEAFLASKPSVVVECASASALAGYGPKILAAGIDLIPLSLTALADADVERRLMEAAATGPGRLEIVPGAIGTLDLLATAREDRLKRVVYRQLKSPAMWQLTPAASFAELSSIRERQVFFRGSVREVARRLPNNLNTSVGVALAGLGLDATEAELVADPSISETAHELEIHAAPGRAVLMLGGREVGPDGDPVDYTTFSLIRALKRRGARVAI